ncbi:hypothetical protein [Providencia hangzhouensis]|uniref:hypothetical protein n=1 Tax=Providencia hangzhouensis TaxID=3031799 RepID=UPI0034DD530C
MKKTTQINKNLGEYIKNIRVNKKISAHEMADSLNIKTAIITNMKVEMLQFMQII